jgi:hypothetical protein
MGIGMSYEWDPWRRYERELERRTWDPFYRYEWEQERRMYDPWIRMEYERERMQWDPYFRAEKQMSDPLYRYEQEQQRLREDPWSREVDRRGLEVHRTYVWEKENGPSDWNNMEYRVFIHSISKRKEAFDYGEFMEKFFDPDWMTVKEVENQLEMFEDDRKRQVRERKKGGVWGVLGRIFGF